MEENKGFTVRIPRAVASLVIGYFVAGLAVWNMPDSVVKARLWPWFGPQLHWLGLWQGWNMFSPNPMNTNIEIVATVEYRDGFKRLYQFPELSHQGALAAFMAIPFRKLLVELPQHTWALPDVARYVARKVDDRKDPPIRVSFICYAAPLPPPEIGLGRPIPTRTERISLGTYPVAESDL